MMKKSNNYFGTRLKMARVKAGLSLQGLSDKLNNIVTKQALNKYEQGLINPSSKVLAILSKTLNIKPDYLLKKSVLDIGDIAFRKKSSLSKKNENAILENAKDYVERFLEVENILGVNKGFDNPLNKIVIKDRDDAENAANILREKWNLGKNPVPQIVEMLELKGIVVQLVDVIDAFDGLSFVTSDNTPVIVINVRLKPIERIRFTVIHELAHYMLKIVNKSEEEVLCHAFSSSFLLPSCKLIKMIGGEKRSYININEIITIKEYYGISIRAIIHRLRNHQVITQSYYQRWMIYLSKTYGKKSEPGIYVGEEKAIIFENLVNRALAEGIISIGKAAYLLNISIDSLRKKNANVDS